MMMTGVLRGVALGVFLVLGVGLGPATGLAGADLKTLKSGVWNGALRGDDQGAATSCYLAAQKSNKAFWIILGLDENGLSITLYNKNWHLTEGKTFTSRVTIDKRLFGDVDATVTDPTAMAFKIGNDEPSYTSIQVGRRISFATPKGRKSFKLEGTNKAVDVLLNCFDTYLDGGDIDTGPHSYEAGLDAYKGKNYGEAFGHWQSMAKAGEPKSQNAMGILYYNGLGVAADLSLAAQWFRRAADQGVGTAQNNLGEMYRDGEGVDQDDAAATKWFRLAAAQDVKGAQANLDKMASSGRLKPAQEPTPADVLVGQSNDPDALVNLAMGILAELEPGTTEEAFRLADRGAALGSSRGQFMTGLMLIDGVGVARDHALGIARMLAAAQAGDVDALTFMGTQYLQDGDDATNATGMEYLARAAEMGDTAAQSALSFYQSEASE